MSCQGNLNGNRLSASAMYYSSIIGFVSVVETYSYIMCIYMYIHINKVIMRQIHHSFETVLTLVTTRVGTVSKLVINSSYHDLRLRTFYVTLSKPEICYPMFWNIGSCGNDICVCKVSIWNVNCARKTAFIFNSRMFPRKCRRFLYAQSHNRTKLNYIMILNMHNIWPWYYVTLYTSWWMK